MRAQEFPLLVDRPRLGALTSLRWLAAVWIMCFHMNSMGGLKWAHPWIQGLASRGYVAVSFFFILSGFILVYTYGGKQIDLKRFWNARLARLYPVYLLSLLVSSPFFIMVLFQPQMIPGGQWFAKHLGLTAALVLTMQQAWVPMAALGWNAVGWAVSAEIFFYIVFPLLLGRMSRLSLGSLLLLAVCCWFAALAAAGLYVRTAPDGIPVTTWLMPDAYFWLHALKFNPLVRLPEFVAGMACGLWFLRGGHGSARATALVAGGAVLLLGLLLLSRFIPYPLMHTGLTVPAYAALVCGLALRPSWSAFLESKLPMLLGESSYSLFLLHPFVVGMALFMPSDFTSKVPPVPTPLRCAIGVTISVLLGLVVFRYVEEPLRKRIRFGKAKG